MYMVVQSGKRVLLVDDEPLFRKVFALQLVAAGYIVRTACDGLDALAKLRAGLPHLIVSDLNMPRMSGRDFLEIVRKRFPNIPVIVISAESMEQPMEVAADAYYCKSGLRFPQFLETLSKLTRKNPQPLTPVTNCDAPVQARTCGNGYMSIRCDDCLREITVPQTHKDHAWTTCVHCGKGIEFLVPEHSRTSYAKCG
jgi:CheY-like chemotaxis protein